MKILICNERFLFRFGVDRVLLILAQYLISKNHEITIMANKVDNKVIENLNCNCIIVPECKEYKEGNEFTEEWLKKNWSDKNYFDIALVAGWPFLASINFLKQKKISVVFNDYGVVDKNGFSGYHLEVLNKLTDLRKQYMPCADLIIGISDFITETQSVVDGNGCKHIQTQLLGSNHLEYKLWDKDQIESDDVHFESVRKDLLDDKIKTIFVVGRWETNCYKNVESSFEIIRSLKNKFNRIKTYVLAEDSDILIPYDLQEEIVPLGFISDTTMNELIENVDLSLCMSLWEGFNLPLAELQWKRSEILVFDVAAHREVVFHPWYLCGSMDEMSYKAEKILKGDSLPKEIREPAYDIFMRDFNWESVCKKYEDAFKNIAQNQLNNIKFIPSMKNRYELIIDVTNATKDTANSGVMRVTRRLSSNLQKFINPIFVVWENGQYVLPTQEEFNLLASYNGPYSLRELSIKENRIGLDAYLSNSKKMKFLMFTETINEKEAIMKRQYARGNGMFLVAIFYDAISILHPELCNEEVTSNHADYMEGLSKCDIVMPISQFSADCLKEFWLKGGIEPTRVVTNQLSAEYGGKSRERNTKDIRKKGINILCVSTLEPRKNHKKLIEAFLKANKLKPELELSLTLVGNRYAGNDEIPRFVEEIQAKNKNIKWLKVVDDKTLKSLYEECDFTIYPSLIEGFGMPIIESLWCARPCICNNSGVMEELASAGGCLTVDVTDIDQLSNAILELSGNNKLYQRLINEATYRYIKLWDDYAKEIINIIEAFAKDKYLNQLSQSIDWKSTIYKNCLLNGWQMNDSEKLGLKAMIATLRPRCSVEIGTFRGGSLSLISQYSDIVFSIDIDEEVKEKFSFLKNVIFLTGPSQSILPLLFDELYKRGLSIDFILVDGDHSYEGVKKDFNLILDYMPKKPLFIMAHDSFNPDCRRGMIEADWNKSDYVQYVDLDFIPGRMIEYGGGANEMWGGLAMAYIDPTEANSNKIIYSTSNKTYNILKEICYDKGGISG